MRTCLFSRRRGSNQKPCAVALWDVLDPACRSLVHEVLAFGHQRLLFLKSDVTKTRRQRHAHAVAACQSKACHALTLLSVSAERDRKLENEHHVVTGKTSNSLLRQKHLRNLLCRGCKSGAEWGHFLRHAHTWTILTVFTVLTALWITSLCIFNN